MNQAQFRRWIMSLTRVKSKSASVILIAVILVLAWISELLGWGTQDLLTDTTCEVIKVSDGDTITVRCAGQPEKVRFYCIDTPELKQTPWGQRAQIHLQNLIETTVQLNRIETDRYGRTVAEVFSGAKNLNLAQVEAGQAAVYERYCQKEAYYVAQQQAQAAQKGIWSQPGLQQRPWQWRREN